MKIMYKGVCIGLISGIIIGALFNIFFFGAQTIPGMTYSVLPYTNIMIGVLLGAFIFSMIGALIGRSLDIRRG